MMLSKKDLRKGSNSRAATTCAILMLVVLLVVASTGRAVSEPRTVAEIALYQGPDREKVLIEGAKKEGEVTLYVTYNQFMTVAQEFEKKYPFIKVSVWRSDSKKLHTRVIEEHKAGRFVVDVIETTDPFIQLLHKEGIFQEYCSPEMGYYGDMVKVKGETGVYYLGDLENYLGLGFNTKRLSPAEAPKTYKDLLNPKWGGKMSIAGTSTGVWWTGNVLEVMGREFLEKMSGQGVRVHTGSGFALAEMVVSGEVPLSPTIYNSDMSTAKQKGAPVEWRSLEPAVARVGYSGMTTKAPHPHAALLFLDYTHSKEGQQILIKGGLNSPREDIGSLDQKFKKTYLEGKYSLEEYEKKFNEWEKLMMQLFIRKR